jgi:hypothetical protein
MKVFLLVFFCFFLSSSLPLNGLASHPVDLYPQLFNEQNKFHDQWTWQQSASDLFMSHGALNIASRFATEVNDSSTLTKIDELNKLAGRALSSLPDQTSPSTEIITFILRDMDGDGEDDILFLAGIKGKKYKQEFSQPVLLYYRNMDSHFFPVIRVLETPLSFRRLAWNFLNMNRIPGFELLVKLYPVNEQSDAMLFIFGRDIKKASCDLLSFFSTNNNLDQLPDVSDLHNDGYVEVFRYQKINAQSGVFRFPHIYGWSDHKLQPVTHGYHNFYQDIADQLAIQRRRQPSYLPLDPDFLQLQIKSNELASNYKTAEGLYRELLITLGKSTATTARMIATIRNSRAINRQKKLKQENIEKNRAKLDY